MKTSWKNASTEMKIASGVLILLVIALAALIIGAIVDTILLSLQPKEESHEHQWVTVYYSPSAPAVLKRCLACDAKDAKLKDSLDIEFTPYLRQSCNHMHYTYVSETFGTDLASDGKIYTYKCDDCGNRWEILITETSTKVIKEWKDK